MIELVTIKKADLHKFITLAYWEDYELFTKYHIKHFDTVYDAVMATYDMIMELEDFAPLVYYAVKFRGQDIGYMVTFDNCLYSFGINIRFRIAEVLKQWMKAVRDLFNYNFYCALYSNNVRAIDFFKKNNFIVVMSSDAPDLVTLINEYSCQS